MIRNPPAMTIMAFGFWENIAPKSFSEPAPQKKKTKQKQKQNKNKQKNETVTTSAKKAILYFYISKNTVEYKLNINGTLFIVWQKQVCRSNHITKQCPQKTINATTSPNWK